MARKARATPHAATSIPKLSDFRKVEYYIDRELSWLAFNDRVIEEAEDESTPLLERLKFLGISSSNLDEFFMVRVSGIQEQVNAAVRKRNLAGFTPEEQFQRVHARAQRQMSRMFECFQRQVQPTLEQEGIFLHTYQTLSRRQKEFVREYFDSEVFPVLTPLGVDSGHPFPHLRNLSLNLAVRLAPDPNSGNGDELFAVVQVPTVIDRLVELPCREGRHEFLLLETLISAEVPLLFPGLKVLEVCAFRVTRDADIEFAEEEADDLLKTIESELRRRERGSAVRLAIESTGSDRLLAILHRTVGIDLRAIYRIDGPLNLAEVAGICNRIDRADLRYPPYKPTIREPLRTTETSLFQVIRRQDVLLHHPYESFGPVVDFISRAAQDPNVLAIKQTMYRTSGDSKIVQALMEAAENGKQVAALVELKARFDEERNIEWARRMEKAGVHVVYGLVGLKTHAKVCLVVRKEKNGLRRYVHLGTGNYNPTTARLYTDLGLLTCDPDLCDDASELFNLLTGYSRMPTWRKMIVAPLHMRDFFNRIIDRETRRALSGKPGRIRAKMNSLVDGDIIARLYKASCAGVRIDLQVRGICCLRPGIKGVSDNIRVSSIVDRYLEHSRIYIFGEGEDEQVYLSSADWMNRNLDRRIETAFPIESPELKKRVIEEIWAIGAADNVRGRLLLKDGSYRRVPRREGDTPLRAQFRFMEIEEGLQDEKEGVTADMLVGKSASGQNGETPLRPPQPAARSLPHLHAGAARKRGQGTDPLEARLEAHGTPASEGPLPPAEGDKSSSA